MWDTQPVLYWRVKKNGKWAFQKAKSAMTQMGLYAIEPPVYSEVGESD
jgi:hypothetical protein